MLLLINTSIILPVFTLSRISKSKLLRRFPTVSMCLPRKRSPLIWRSDADRGGLAEPHTPGRTSGSQLRRPKVEPIGSISACSQAGLHSVPAIAEIGGSAENATSARGRPKKVTGGTISRMRRLRHFRRSSGSEYRDEDPTEVPWPIEVAQEHVLPGREGELPFPDGRHLPPGTSPSRQSSTSRGMLGSSFSCTMSAAVAPCAYRAQSPS